MPLAPNPYSDNPDLQYRMANDTRYIDAATQLAEALFGSPEKASALADAELNRKYKQAQVDYMGALAQSKLNPQPKAKTPVAVAPKQREMMQQLADTLLSSQLGEGAALSNLPGIPAETTFAAQQAGENAYQNTRDPYAGARALVAALGIPPAAKLGEIDTTPGSNWNPLNWGGGKPAIILGNGQPWSFTNPAPAAVPVAPPPAPVDMVPLAAPAAPTYTPPAAPAPAPQAGPVRVNSPADAARLPSGTLFITPDGRTIRKR